MILIESHCTGRGLQISGWMEECFSSDIGTNCAGSKPLPLPLVTCNDTAGVKILLLEVVRLCWMLGFSCMAFNLTLDFLEVLLHM